MRNAPLQASLTVYIKDKSRPFNPASHPMSLINPLKATGREAKKKKKAPKTISEFRCSQPCLRSSSPSFALHLPPSFGRQN